MTLLWLLLILAVIGVVGVVASGYGGGMSTPEPDLPPLGLPAGPLRAEDLDAVRFSTAVRGYRMDQVDVVLDRLRSELAARDETIAELRHGPRQTVALEKQALAPHEPSSAEPGATPLGHSDEGQDSPWRS